ncbi:MAG: IPT/TIG domain-containing protein [Bryobacteraceae bacterium]
MWNLWGVVAVCAVAAPLSAQNQVLTCRASATPPVVHAEGMAERVGDISLACSGGVPNAGVSGNLSLFLSVNVTNHIDSANSPDVVLTIDTGSGPVPSGVAPLLSGNTVAFNGVDFRLSSAGAVTLRVSNLRGAASQLQLAPNQFVTVSAAFNSGSPLAIANSTFTVAAPQPGFFASYSTRLICAQSPSVLPAPMGFSNLITAGTAFASTRITEGFASSFAPRSDISLFNANSGIRIIARYSGFPSGARLFVPDAVAGSDAVQPTAGGDFGPSASGGQYAAGSGTLLLIRVNNADSTGAGGALAMQPPSAGTVSFDSVGEIALSGGSGYAVYEVADSNPTVLETAQFPTFLGWPGSGNGVSYQTNETVNLGPLSNVLNASALAPVPRFIDAPVPSDCGILNDCGADYFPQLWVDPSPLAFKAVAGAPFQVLYVIVNNLGSGLLQWTASVNYTNGSGWLRISPVAGLNNGTIRVDALPENLAPGDYSATLTVNGGSLAGSRTVPVTLDVTAAPPQPPQIAAITNAASLAPGPLVAGSLATIMGSRLGGDGASVAFDGAKAQLLYTSATQINLLVPPALGAKTSAQVVVTSGGLSSAPLAITLATAAPAIFSGGVLNQDSSVNSPSNAAKTGTILQVFATGLPADGIIRAKVHDRPPASVYYGGPAPGLIGVQQVNVQIPADLPSMQTWVSVCGAASATLSQLICSPGAQITITQ